MDVTSAGGLTRRQEQGEEVDFDALRLVKTNHDVHVEVSDKVDLQGLPTECNLMAISNKWGILAAGSNNDVRIHRLNDLHRLLENSPKDASPTSAPCATLALPGRPVWIRLAANEEVLLVATQQPTTLQSYRLRDVMSGNTNAFQSVTAGLPDRILDLLPNPASPTASEALARTAALVTSEGLTMLDIESGRISTSLAGQLTCASWSPKGKQIVCGERSGTLRQCTPEGAVKAEILPPPELGEDFYPTSVEWIENDIFLVSYKSSNAEEDEPSSVFTIRRSKATSEIVYHEFFDPINTMGLPTRSGSHRFVAGLKQWGDSTRRLEFLMSGRSSEVGVMRMTTAETPVWEALMLDEAARGVMPAGKSGVSEDSSCIGLELDLTSTKPIKLGLVGGVEVPDMPPAPRLLAYSHEGFIISFDIRYEGAGGYPYMVEPKDIAAAPQSTESDMDSTNAVTATPTAPEPQPEQKPAFGGFGSSSSTTGGFGASAFGKPAASTSSTGGFGQSAFGQPTSSGSGFGQSAFGQSSTPASGSKSPFGASSSTPAFGASAFGQKTDSSSPAPSTSAFGKPASGPAFGQSGFGGSSPSPSGGFGQAGFGQKPISSSSAFGQPAFGSASSPSTQSPFGATNSASQPAASSSPSPGFGQSAFGQKPAAAATATPSTPAGKPAFGQSGFGQSSTPSASASAFGQSAFGQPSKPSASAFGQPATSSSASAFGTTSTANGSSVGFAGFGQKSGSQTGGFGGFGSSAFGQNKSTSASASSPFGSGGAVATGSGGGGGSAFGSSSGFGQSGFGAKPAAASPFGTTPAPATQTTSQAAPIAAADKGPSSGFGLGGLDSALDSPQPQQGGMDDTTPPDSPVGPSKPKPAPQLPASNTPPDSPIFGASKGLSGRDEDEDDSPPPTPKPAPAFSTTPANPPAAAGSTSSFIKPATAFGSSTSSSTPPSSAFGSFGQTSKPGSSSVPNAFSKPVSSTTPATPGSAFGTSGFGSSAFGKPSTPSATSAFGKPAAPPAVGNITGGFGGFAPKKADSPSGFAGFGSASTTGKSAFGSTSGFGSSTSSSGTAGNAFAALLSGGKSKEDGSPKSVEIKQEEKEKEKETVAPSKSTTPPATPKPADAQSTTPSSSPAPPVVVKQEETTPEPQGYDVPSDDTSKTPVTSAKDSRDTVEASTTPTAVPPTAATAPAGEESTESSPSSIDPAQTGRDASAAEESPSSPELIEHEDAEVDHDEQHEGDSHEDGEEAYSDEYDEDEEKEEEGYSDEQHDDEEYDEEEDYEDENEDEEAEGEEEAGREREREETPEPEVEVKAEPASSESAPVASDGKAAPPSSSDGSSLFSRLGPPTIGKHAVRTSSPLGSQPPETAQTDTPPGSPPKAPKDASNSAPPPFFGGFNKPSTSGTPSQGQSPFAGLGKGAPPSLFGNTKPAGPAPATTTPPTETGTKAPFSFGLGKPSAPPTPAPAKEPEQKPSGFSFGSSNALPATASPAASTTPASKSSFSFGSAAPTAAATTNTPAPPPASLFGQQQQQPVKPGTPAAKPAADPGKYATPARTPIKESTQAQDDGSRQMAAVMTRMITDLMSEIKDMKDAMAAHADYHRGLEPKFNKVSIDDLDAHTDLPFSSLSDIAAVIDQLAADMSGVAQQDKKSELRVLDLQSKMVKTDMKVKQAERLVTAQDDATFAYHSQPQDLSASQAEERASLRRRKQAAESRLEDLERSVERLKRTAAEGRPTIDKLHQSIEEVEAALVDKQDLVEDLSMRIKSIRLSTPGARRSLAPGSSSRMPAGQKSASASASLYVPEDIVADVERQLDQQSRKPKFAGIKVARVTRPSSSTGSGPVQIGNLPLPGKIDISSLIQQNPEPSSSASTAVKKEEQEVVAENKTDARPTPGATTSTPSVSKDTAPAPPSTPASTAAPASAPAWPPAFSLAPDAAGSSSPSPSPAFGGIKLSLDPGDLSGSHTRTRATTSGTRAHHAAPRFGTSPSAEKAPASPAAGSPSTSPFSFFPPPKGTGSESPSSTTGNSSSPKGFFSLSGYAQK